VFPLLPLVAVAAAMAGVVPVVLAAATRAAQRKAPMTKKVRGIEEVVIGWMVAACV